MITNEPKAEVNIDIPLIQHLLSTQFPQLANEEIKFLDAGWDNENYILYSYSEEVPLTKKERDLLILLFSSKNRVFTYDEIFEYIWSHTHESSMNSLKSLVKTLRKKIPKEKIRNVSGVGYTIDTLD